MKRKILSTVLVLGMVFAVGLAGCGKKESSQTENVENTDENTETGDVASTFSVSEFREKLLEGIEADVELGDYSTISVDVEKIEVTDEDVQEEIDSYLTYYGETEQITEGTVAEGDIVNIDYVGKLDGVAFENGSDTAYDLEIGSGTFIEGFEEALIGATVGEMTTIDVTFPDDYSETDLAGKAATFDVTINYKQGESIPAELNDEFVVGLAIGDDVTTVDAFKEYVRTSLEDTATSTMEENAYYAIIDELISICTVNSFDEDLNADTLFEEEMAYMEEYATDYSVSIEELASYYGMTLDEYKENLKTDLEEYVKQYMIFRAIVNAENIDITQEELDAEIAGYSVDYESYGLSSVEEFEETYSSQIYEMSIYLKVEELLLEKATINYTDAVSAETTAE